MVKLKRRTKFALGAVAALVVVLAVGIWMLFPYNPRPLDAITIHSRVALINETAGIAVPHGELDDPGARAQNAGLFDLVAAGKVLTEEQSAAYRIAYQALLQHNQAYLGRFDSALTVMQDVAMQHPNNVGSSGIAGSHDHHDQSIRSNVEDLVSALDRLRSSGNPFVRVSSALKAYKDVTDVLLHAATIPQTKSIGYMPQDRSAETRLGADLEFVLAAFKEAQFEPVNSKAYVTQIHAALDRYDLVIRQVQEIVYEELGPIERSIAGTWGGWQSLGPGLENRRADRIPRECLRSVPEQNGLSDCDRQAFYHLAEGSELIPLSWLLALENTKTGAPFLADVARFGLIADPNGPNGLPIGFSKSRPKGALGFEVVGINCAACHTTEIHYNGTAYRIDGAPGMFNISRLIGELIESLAETLNSSQALMTFLVSLQSQPARVAYHQSFPTGNVDTGFPAAMNAVRLQSRPMLLGARSPEEIDARLAAIVADEQAAFDREQAENPEQIRQHTLTDEDADLAAVFFHNINEQGALQGEVTPQGGLQVYAMKEPLLEMAVRTSPQGSVWRDVEKEIGFLIRRIAFLKSLALEAEETEAGYGRLDAFGGARNLLFGTEFGAQPKTAPVSFPALWNFENKAWLHWTANTNSVLERNIGQALGLGAIFRPGSYDTTVEIDKLHQLEVLARRIESPAWPDEVLPPIAADKARQGEVLFDEHCSECHRQAVDLGNGLLEYRLLSIEDVGTDPNAAINFDASVGTMPFYARSAEILTSIKQAYLNRHSDIPDLEFGREPVVWRSPLSDRAVAPRVYPALPLDGIWARAPYLHNDSVPSLYDLLLPSAERPDRVLTGSRVYDPDKVGFSQTEASEHTFWIETRTEGNSNSGHEYGTDLTATERLQLLEYLKTL